MVWVGRFLPLTYAVRLLQDPWLGFGWSWNDTLVVIGITIVAIVVSLRFFRWESRRR